MKFDQQNGVGSSATIVLQLFVLSIALMLPGMLMGHIVGHSSFLNVNWAQGFEQELSKGIWYPRWLPEMNGGAGSPVFYFYGPLPFYISAPFTALFGSAALGVIMGIAVMLAASGVAMYLLCTVYASRSVALLAAAIYMMLPYHFAIDIWFRSAFGEQAAFIFMPLMAYSILRLADNWRFAILLSFAFAGQLLSHLPTALLFSPVLVVLTCWVAWRGKSWVVILQSGAAGLAGIGLASVYLLPALSLQSMIQNEHWKMIVPSEHLLVFDAARKDFTTFILPQGFAIALALYLCFMQFKNRRTTGDIYIWTVIVLAALFFSSILAWPFWLHAGPFAIVQFPWRLLSVLDLAMAVLIASLLERGLIDRKKLIQRILVVIGFGFFIAGQAQYLFYHSPDDPTLMNIKNDQDLMAIRTDGSEYLPGCLDQSQVEYKITTYDRIHANQALQPQDGRLPVYSYPFLDVIRGGQVIPSTCDPETGFIKYDPTAGQGPVAEQAKTLPIEKTAGWVSLASLVILLGVGAAGSARRKPGADSGIGRQPASLG